MSFESTRPVTSRLTAASLGIALSIGGLSALGSDTNLELTRNDAAVRFAADADVQQLPRSQTGMCATDTPAASLLPTDCIVMAAPDTDKALTHQKVPAMQVSFQQLPQPYQNALTVAFDDPIGRQIKNRYPVTYFADAAGTTDNALYYSGDRAISFEFLTNGPPRTFRTWGAVRSVIMHEGTHGLYHNWNIDTNDAEDRADIALLNTIWADNISRDLEQYRQLNQSKLRGYAQKLAACIEARKFVPSRMHDVPEYRSALKAFSEAVSTPGALGKFLILRDDADTGWHGLSPDEAMAKTLGRGSIRASSDSKGCKRAFDRLEEDTYYYQWVQFAYLNESSVQRDISSATAGHSNDATTEQTASLFSNIQMNPDGVIAMVKDADPRRRDREFVQTVARLMRRNDPAVYKYSNLQYVIDRIS